MKKMFFVKLQRFTHLGALFLSLMATSAHGSSCIDDFKRLLSRSSADTVQIQDRLIQETLGLDKMSFSFFGQSSIDKKTYDLALKELSSPEGLSISKIQRAHKILSKGKSVLSFRTEGDAHLVGRQSFKGYHALSSSQKASLEPNPFLRFEEADDYIHVGTHNPDKHVGHIVFPNIFNIQKFKSRLSQNTIDAIAKNKKKDNNSDLNAQILEDLLQWSLKEAETALKSKKEAPEKVLAELEWRVKSLGLYYEPIYRPKGRWSESDYTRVDFNRSNELAEVIVDAFAHKHGLLTANESLDRGFRPQLYDELDDWVVYMSEALSGNASRKLKSLVSRLESQEAKLPASDRPLFRDYYMTRLLTGSISDKTPEAEILSSFKKFKSQHYARSIPEVSRALLIPIDFIRSFGSDPSDISKYLDRFYHRDAKLFRGVSNPRKMSEGDYIDYFKSYKGRMASELARTVFEERIELSKLAMLQFNIDLIEGRVVQEALQHASKHASWKAPNSAKTYLTSTTDFDTVAFRFAMDKGYVSGSSALTNGSSHFVMETLRPISGSIDFMEFRKTDDSWRNFYPRQREVAIAGGLDPYSVKRIYELEPYAPNDNVPDVGPEKHGRIVRIYERDEKDPCVIKILERNSENPDKWDEVKRRRIQ
jgi:hypothetical protein